MNQSLAIFGCGKMGSALVGGLVKSGLVTDWDVCCFDVNVRAATELAAEYGLRKAESEVEAAVGASVVVVCVKPVDVVPLLRSIGDGSSRLVISIAAGVDLRVLQEAVGSQGRVVRVMPNTPASIGKGMSAYCVSPDVTVEDIVLVEAIFSAVGEVMQVPERMMNAVTGLSGSGPAYVFTMIEALADGACLCGIPKAQALRMAAQTVAGAAALVLQCGEHPSVLRDQVTSPGGTTIAGLAAMERAGVRAGLIDAVCAAAKRSSELG